MTLVRNISEHSLRGQAVFRTDYGETFPQIPLYLGVWQIAASAYGESTSVVQSASFR